MEQYVIIPRQIPKYLKLSRCVANTRSLKFERVNIILLEFKNWDTIIISGKDGTSDTSYIIQYYYWTYLINIANKLAIKSYEIINICKHIKHLF